MKHLNNSYRKYWRKVRIAIEAQPLDSRIYGSAGPVGEEEFEADRIVATARAI
jgi:hypothetical protein